MLSNGEIYHMSFRLRKEFVEKGIQAPIMEIREELRSLSAQGMSKEELEKKVRELMTFKYGKKP